MEKFSDKETAEYTHNNINSINSNFEIKEFIFCLQYKTSKNTDLLINSHSDQFIEAYDESKYSKLSGKVI